MCWSSERVAGPKRGLAELDHITLRSVKPDAQPGWKSARAKLPKFTPAAAKSEPKKNKATS